MYLWQCWIESNYTLIKNELLVLIEALRLPQHGAQVCR